MISNYPLGVACYDAGAANIIFSYISNLTINRFFADVDGPALKIFKSYFPKKEITPIKKFINKTNCLITGTGWSSKHEHNARVLASTSSVKSIAVLDHWVNYRERFIFEGVKALPDEIWVSDDYAYKIASKIFIDLKIKKIVNYYMLEQIKLIKKYSMKNKSDTKLKILYLLEPIRKVWKKNEREAGEFQALNFFLENFQKLKVNKGFEILLKPHPSEKANKYKVPIVTIEEFHL